MARVGHVAWMGLNGELRLGSNKVLAIEEEHVNRYETVVESVSTSRVCICWNLAKKKTCVTLFG